MKSILHVSMAAIAAIALSGCMGAALNKVELTLNRNITVGQELMDLQAAHEKGIITEAEYLEAKKDILNLFDQLGEMQGSGKSKQGE